MESEDEQNPESGESDVKRKFREALERKQNTHADSELAQGTGGNGKGAGPHGPAHTQRTFRRKSG